MSAQTKRVSFFFKASFWLIIVLPIIGLAILGLLLFKDGVMLAYHMRIPILATGILFILPIVTFRVKSVKQLLGNLFVLSGPIQIASVVVAAIVFANAILLIFDLIWETGPVRFGYSNPNFLTGWSSPFDVLPFLEGYKSYLYSVLLAFPLLFTTLTKTREGRDETDSHNPLIWRGLFFGILSIFIIAFASNLALVNIDKFNIDFKVQERISSIDFIENCDCLVGYEGEYTVLHLRAIAFQLVGIVFYLLVGIASHPVPGFLGRLLRKLKKFASRKQDYTLPHVLHDAALFYILLLLTSLTLFLGALAYIFDYMNLPVLLTLVVFSFGMSWFWKTKNQYSVTFKDPYAATDEEGNGKELCYLIQKRLDWQRTSGKKSKALVIISLKGGGIHSAGWAVRVLSGLQERGGLGESFAKSVVLLSGVSGGAVGAMHYINNLDPEGNPAGEAMQAFKDATADSLDAASWGILYLDFWRLIGLPFLIFPERDRGWAIEQDWKAVMNTGAGTTLSSLHKRVKDGEIPIPVFNATVAADGSPIFFSPMCLPFTKLLPDATEKNFIARLTDKDQPGMQADIDITTAARLSAAFPYVSPISRNNQGDETMYLADGGYFDNFGLFSAINFVEWLKSSDHAEHAHVDKVLLVSVRAFPPEEKNDKEGSNWMHSVTGPVSIMMAGRSTSQAEHLSKEVDLLQDLLKQSKEGRPIDFRTVNIAYPGGVDNPPLSWKLSPREKKNIIDAWDHPSVQKSVAEIESIWKDWEVPQYPKES